MRARRLRRRVALLAAGWSMLASSLVLGVVGLSVLGSGVHPFGGDGDGSGMADSGRLRSDLRRLTGGSGLGGGLVKDTIADVKRAYLGTALTWAIIAIILVGALSALAGWWLGGRATRVLVDGDDLPRR